MLELNENKYLADLRAKVCTTLPTPGKFYFPDLGTPLTIHYSISGSFTRMLFPLYWHFQATFETRNNPNCLWHNSTLTQKDIQLTFFRFLHEQSEENYFVLGTNPVGKACETTALLVPSDDLAFKVLVDLLKVEIFSLLFYRNQFS